MGDAARWQIEVEIRHAELKGLEAALEDEADAILTEAISEADPLDNHPDDVWRLRAIAAERAGADALAATVRRALAATRDKDAAITVVPLGPRDWVAEVERDAPPIALGRFLIHGSHHRATRTGRTPLRIDAGFAFGSGRHQTTRGCLRLIEAARARRTHLRRALDLGTGSGILAVAIARLWHCPVVASDIDPESVRACRHAAAINGVAAHVLPVESDGLEAAEIREAAPFDLIAANILAGPLVRLAPRLVPALAPRGLIVLSGLLRRQEAAVLAAYRARGCVLSHRLRDGEWTTLALRRPRAGVHWS